MPSESHVDCTVEPLDGVDIELTAFDEGLRHGEPVEETAIDASPSDEAGGLRDCVRLLRRAWPKPVAAPNVASLPQRLGRFEIERVLGCGGFGIVYLATDPALKRLVALKVPRLLSLADSSLRDRFRREARAAAGLDHPHIVPIHETGVEGGVDYLAAAYCPGPNLAEWIKQQSVAVSPRRAASLLVCLADAIQYSHQHGVLHRDLKPSNVLLMPRTTETSREGNDELPFIPRLTDFGLARILDDSGSETQGSAMLGTPNYMAPEQTGGNREDIGPAVDIYGLGVILYEILAGRPPFQAESFVDVIDQVRQSAPVPLRRLRRDVPRDLEIICLKCLEKRPRDRYATAGELHDDLERFLRGEPLKARPPGWGRAVFNWARRRPLVAALVALASFVAVVGPLQLISHNRQLSNLTTDLSRSLHESQQWQREAEGQRTAAQIAAREADEGRTAAETAKHLADARSRERAQLAYASSIHLAELAWREFDIHQCRALLARALEQTDTANPPGVEWKVLDFQTRAKGIEVGEPLEYFCCVAVSPDGRLLAAGGAEGVVQLIDLAKGTVTGSLQTEHGVARAVAFSRKGDRVAVCGDDGTVSVWDAASHSRLQTSPVLSSTISALVWTSDDAWIATAGGLSALRLWRPASGEGSVADNTVDLEMSPHKVTCVAVSNDGLRLAAGDHDGNVRIWDSPLWKPIHDFRNGHAKITTLEFSRAGKHLAVGDNDRYVRVHRFASPAPTRMFELLLRDDIRSLAFSPGDERLAVLEKFGSLHVWILSLTSPQPAKAKRYQHGWLAHEERGSQLVFSPDGGRIASVGRGSARPRVWRTATQSPRAVLPGSPFPHGPRFQLLFTPNSSRLIVGGPQVEVWLTSTSKQTRALSQTPAQRDGLALSADGRWLATSSRGARLVELWDTDGAWSKPEWRLTGQDVDDLAFSPSGGELAVVDWKNDALVLVDRSRGERLRTLPARQCHAAAFSPDGRWLAVDELDDVVLWNTETWSIHERLRGHLSTIQTLAFSSDGRWLATAGDDRLIRLWSTEDWTCALVMNGHRHEIRSVTFTPDNRSLLALDSDSYLKMWHVATGLELCSLHTPAQGSVSRFALSAEANWLALRREDGRVEIRRLKE